MFLSKSMLILATIIVLFSGTLAAAGAPLDFELPTLDGKRFFRLSETHNRITVVNFWDTECPPCVREMPLLDKISKSRPDVLFIGATVSERNKARDFLDDHPVSYLQLAKSPDPAEFLRRFGDPFGALPHTVVLGNDHSLCAMRTGEIDQDWIDSVLQHCR
ncbi:MAG TPA: TlpA disulfide reductase family protein [Gallionella sp.]|nr:TlpA disulfide reductase family protein [Gallionella sp.]